MEAFQQWLDRLAKELSLEEALTLDEYDQCFLLFDEKILVQIHLKEKENVFSFTSKLGNVDERQMSLLYPRLLEANMLWKETHGATLGIQQFSEMVLLVQHTQLSGCTYESFEKGLEIFVNTVEFWLDHLEALQLECKKQKRSPRPTGIQA